MSYRFLSIPSLPPCWPVTHFLCILSFTGRRHDPKVLIEGVLFRARYLGSTQLICEGQPTKATRMMQAEEAVSRIKVGSLSNRNASCTNFL